MESQSFAIKIDAANGKELSFSLLGSMILGAVTRIPSIRLPVSLAESGC
jgi:hypothetical protein